MIEETKEDTKLTKELDCQVRAKLLEKFESRYSQSDDEFLDSLDSKIDILKPKIGKNAALFIVSSIHLHVKPNSSKKSAAKTKIT